MTLPDSAQPMGRQPAARVSVVVPTYNAPAYLLQTLQTVFDQTFADFELIVIDDGSTDDTPQALATITDPRLRVVRQLNGGIGAARNRGIVEANGEFIAFLDHDDLWAPQKLAAQVDFLDHHPQLVAATCPWEYSSEPGHCVFDLALAGPDGAIIKPYRAMADKHQFVITAALMVRRAALAGVRYCEVRGGAEDVAFYMQLFARGGIGVAGNSILMTYRFHPANFSKQASYFDIGVRSLRQMKQAGAFAEVEGENQCEMLRHFAVLGRNGVINQLLAGHRAAALRLYLREAKHQAAARAWKFLLATPLLFCLPTAIVRSMVNRNLRS